MKILQHLNAKLQQTMHPLSVPTCHVADEQEKYGLDRALPCLARMHMLR